jgi:putative salt-induced outer membrane protein YdiY
MRIAFVVAALALATTAAAQDKVTLANGDVLTGTIKTLADGKLVITSPVLGDVVVEFAKVKDITTQDQVRVLTSSGDLLRRRIAGIENGQLKFADQGQELLANIAQLNPPEAPEPKWTGALKVGAGFFSGNTDRRNIGAAFDAELRRSDDRISADGSWDYAQDKPQGSTNWNLTQRRVGGGLKYDRFLTKSLYYLLSTRVLGDTLADIELRYTVGAGLGYQILDDATTKLSAEAGLSWFYENYRSGAPTVDYLAARIAYKVRHEFSDKTRLIHGVEAYPSLERAEDVYFQATTELQTNLTDSMIGSLSWVWDYDNTPSPGHDRSDNRVLLSIGWTF